MKIKKEREVPERIYIIPDLHKDGTFYREWITDGAPQRQGVGYVRLTVLQQILHRFAPDESGTCVCGMLKLWQFHVDEESDQQPPPQIPDKRVAEIRERRAKIRQPPWRVGPDAGVSYNVAATIHSRNVAKALVMDANDAEFIAHAPDDIDYLLSRRQPVIFDTEDINVQWCGACGSDCIKTGTLNQREQRLLQQPAISERCGECALCHHAWEYSKGSICAFYIAGSETPEGVEQVMCGCKCVFSSTGAPMPTLPFACNDCGVQQHADGICANCGSPNLRQQVATAGAGEGTERPKIICLCGSTRFIQTWIDEYQRLSDEGNIVLTVARMPPRPNLQHDEPELKARLDDLHLRKIDLADEVFVLDVDGYIGSSTKREIEYAVKHGKPVWYLSGTSAPATVAEGETQEDPHPGYDCGGTCAVHRFAFPTPVRPPAAPQDELQKLRQAMGWIGDAADAAYIEDPENKYIHDIFNIVAKTCGLTRRLPDEYQRFDESTPTD